VQAKLISFILIMSALGNVLFAISYYTGNIAPGVALDFSLVAVFVAGFYGGPYVGFFSGLFVGILPGIMFGPMGMSSWLGLIGLPIGKALTGLTSGILSKSVRTSNRPRISSLLMIPATLAAYVPEFVFTYAFFAYMMPAILGSGGAYTFIYFIMPKALGEVTVMSVLMTALAGNTGFSDFIGRFFTKTHILPRFAAERRSEK